MLLVEQLVSVGHQEPGMSGKWDAIWSLRLDLMRWSRNQERVVSPFH